MNTTTVQVGGWEFSGRMNAGARWAWKQTVPIGCFWYHEQSERHASTITCTALAQHRSEAQTGVCWKRWDSTHACMRKCIKYMHANIVVNRRAYMQAYMQACIAVRAVLSYQ